LFADYVLCCFVLPVAAFGALWAWVRVPAFGAAAGTVSLAALAIGVPVATVLVGRDVARTDRLVAWAITRECSRPALAGAWYPDEIQQRSIEMSPELATQAGLPARTEAQWPATLRRNPHWLLTGTLLTYAIDAEHGSEVFVGSEGEIGEQRVVIAAQSRDAMDSLMAAPPALHVDAILAHETLDVSWLWIVDDTLATYDDANDGTLELRDLDLRLRARAIGVGALGDPMTALVSDAHGGLLLAVDGSPLAIGHLSADGTWTRRATSLPLHSASRMVSARRGGLCVFGDDAHRGAFLLDGEPLAARAWPITTVLEDRQVELIALWVAWVVAVLAARRVARPFRPWWSLRRGRARVGRVHDARSDGATWNDGAHADRAVRAEDWIAFLAAPAEAEPAVAIDVTMAATNPAYRDSARETLHARWVVRGTENEAARLLAKTLRETVSWVGFLVLLVGVPAMIVAIVCTQ
jgi:hypothetical protein